MNRNRRNRPTSMPKALLNQEQRQTELIKTLVGIQRTQQKGTLELVPDVPRMTLKRDKVYTFSRSYEVGTILSSTTTPVGFASAPSLSTFPNSTDFTNLFEQYRIVQHTFTFIPLLMSTSVQNPIYTWIDQDDDTVPTGNLEAYQNMTMRYSPNGVTVERTLTPQISQDGGAQGGVGSGYVAPSTNLWCDEASPNIKYYGIKALVPVNGSIANGVPLYQVIINSVIQTRRPK